MAGRKALMSVSDVFGLFGCGLFSLAMAANGLRLQQLSLRARIAVLLVLGFAVFVPFGELSVAAYLRGVTGDLSMATLVLACAACVRQLTRRTVIGQRDVRVLLWLLAAAAAFLYPFALGLTHFDPYALGYGSVEFVTALLLLSLAAWRARLNLIVLVVIVAGLAFLCNVYESRNLWDYLIDPLVCGYALARLLAGLRHRPSGEISETAPAA
jgi:hypothetical protein